MEKLIRLRIRKFIDSDASEAARLHRSTIRTINRSDYTPRQIEVWSGRTSAKRFRRKEKGKVRFVAVEKDRIIGFADYKDNELLGLYVHKDYMNKGVGRQLLTHLENFAYKSGIRSFECEATITAHEFYGKNGLQYSKEISA